MSKTITGTFQTASGAAVAFGTLYLKLTQDATVIGTGQIVPATPLAFALDTNGTLGSGITIFASDELTPANVAYVLTVSESGGGQVYGPEFFVISGVSPINLNNLTPSSNSPVVFSQAVLQNPTSTQTITGQSLTLTSTAPLNVNGALAVNAPTVSIGVTAGSPQFPQGLTTGTGTALTIGASAEINVQGANAFATGGASQATISYNTTSQTLGASYNNDTAVPFPRVIASGTSTLTANAALGATTSQAAITTSATGAATTDAIEWSYASAPGAGDSLCIVSAYVTSGNVNFVRSNPTAAGQNVSAIVINWRVIR